MATVSAAYQWAKNEHITIDVYVEDSFPDALDQAVSEATRGLRTALADIAALESQTGDDLPA